MILVIIVALLSASPSVQAVPPSETAASDQSPAAGGPTFSLRDNCPRILTGKDPSHSPHAWALLSHAPAAWSSHDELFVSPCARCAGEVPRGSTRLHASRSGPSRRSVQMLSSEYRAGLSSVIMGRRT